MDVTAELSRLVPRWSASPTRADSDKLLRYMAGIGRPEYEQAVGQLTWRLTHHREAIVNDEKAWYEFVQVVCYQTILEYDRHVPGERILRLLGNKSGVGRDLGSLAQMLSAANRSKLPRELLRREAIQTQGLLEKHFFGARVGIVDHAIDRMLERLQGEMGRKQAEAIAGLRGPADIQLNRSQAHEYKLLRAIQALRRLDAARLPRQPKTSEEIRFLLEETGRHLFGYETKNEKAAMELIDRVSNWYGTSEFYVSTRQNVAIYLIETGFFTELRVVRAKISLGATYEPHWDYYIKGPLRSEKFWNDIAGLNRDVAIESTEAGQRPRTYQRAAAIGGLLFAGLIVLPVAIQLAWAAPGAAVRLFTWTGRGLFLASSYVYRSYRILGFLGGSAKIARDGVDYYMRNPVVINQRMVDVTEIVLDLFTDGTGFAAGASLGDQARLATEKLAVLGKKGVKSLVDDATRRLNHPAVEIEFVKLTIKDLESNYFEVVGKIARDANVPTLVDLRKTAIAGVPDELARRTATFISRPTTEATALPDLRGTLDSGVAGKASAAAARSEAIVARTAANDNRVAEAGVVLDDVARGRERSAAKKALIAWKQSEDMAQKQELIALADRKAADGAGAARMGRGTGGGSKGTGVGNVSPAEGGSAAIRARGTGVGTSSVPAEAAPVLRAVTKSPAGYQVVVDEAALAGLKARFGVKKIFVKVPNSGGGRFQILGVTGVEHEWRLVSKTTLINGKPLQADVDGLALDPDAPGSFILLEAKAAFVEELGSSGHVRFYPSKVEQLSRQLMLCLESKGKMRMEIVTNVPLAAEAYLNMTAQQVATDIRTRFAAQLREYLGDIKGATVGRLSLADVERIVEENVSIVVSDWPSKR